MRKSYGWWIDELTSWRCDFNTVDQLGRTSATNSRMEPHGAVSRDQPHVGVTQKLCTPPTSRCRTLHATRCTTPHADRFLPHNSAPRSDNVTLALFPVSVRQKGTSPLNEENNTRGGGSTTAVVVVLIAMTAVVLLRLLLLFGIQSSSRNSINSRST